MIPSFVDRSKIPHQPGIYMYKDQTEKVIYVGKAIDLYSRVASYFNNEKKDSKTTLLVENITEIETIIVESELEALILEAKLIKKYLPIYNIRLTDDKDYLYIAITKEEFPRVITARKSDLKPIKQWFGPFPSSKTAKNTLKRLRRVFPWCSNPPRKVTGDRSQVTVKKLKTKTYNLKPCFYYHIKLCLGACIGAISRKDYNEIINRFAKFLNGKKQELLEELTKEMNVLANEQKFEEAAKIKVTINGILYLTQPNRVTSYLENPNFLEDERQKALEELQKVLNLPNLPQRIEAYDISNLLGKEATGSMVVLTDGEIDKSQYRRFKIKITGKPNDYAMHREMMSRRLKHPEWRYPDLLLIDGGRGQVRASRESIKYKVLNIKEKNNDLVASIENIPIFGLAKREEWLYPPEGEVVKLPKRSLALRLLQRIRDESHRFAITYHRKLRNKEFLKI